MSFQFGQCPRCQQPVPESRLQELTPICPSCGYCPETKDAQIKTLYEKRFIVLSFLGSAVLVGLFLQLVNWDRHSFTILPLLVKQTIGFATTSDLTAKKEICFERKKWNCVEEALNQLSRSDANKLLELGELQYKRKAYARAAQSLKRYIDQGGIEFRAHQLLALSYGQMGDIQRAIPQYDLTLKARPDVFQVSLVQNFVRLLIAHGRHDYAKTLLDHYRAKSPQSRYFMEAEYKALTTQKGTRI